MCNQTFASSETSTVYSQEYMALEANGVQAPDPRKRCLEELSSIISDLKTKNHMILLWVFKPCVSTLGTNRLLRVSPWMVVKIFSRKIPNEKKLLRPQKKGTMPSALRVGSPVSSKKSSLCKLIDPPVGRKREVWERIRGVIVRSLPDRYCEVSP